MVLGTETQTVSSFSAPMFTVSHHDDEDGERENDNSANRFQVTPADFSYINPMVAKDGDAEDHAMENGYDRRKLSVMSAASGGFGGRGGRRVSRDTGVQVTTTSILPELFPSNMYDDTQWYQLTQDAVPRLEHYRNSQTGSRLFGRPTLDELHDPQSPVSRKISVMLESGVGQNTGPQAVKFGWIRGVYIRCLLNIWGVMLFLRMGWMVGQAGIGLSCVIVLLATVITILTSLSMSAICTNGEVKGGGVYYMISRSLGPEFGGAIGMVFFVGNSVAVAMYIIGAAETVGEILRRYETYIVESPSGIDDQRISGLCLLVLVMCITGVGMAFENKAQLVLLVLLLAAMLDYLVGACLPPNKEQAIKGLEGWSWSRGNTNFGPDFRDSDFFSVFSIFFPSVIGILAGANISGDLKDPCYAIPRGTILAILTTSGSYIIIIVWLGFTLMRDASGEPTDYPYEIERCYFNKTTCGYGMLNWQPVMEMSSGWGPLIFVGIFAATLSSALAALVSAPRIFQALCKDEIFKKLKRFAKGYGPNNDPRRASALVFLIAAGCTAIGELDTVAPIISNFFMCAYCLVNFSCFHASLVKSPGFRPGFRYYNKWLSLVASLICLTVMFVMSWITALATLAIVFGLYVYIQRNQPAVNWGSSTQGYTYKNALSAVTRLDQVEDHVKNYRPAIMVLTGNASSRPPLVDFANSVTKKVGLMVCGHVIKGPLSQAMRRGVTDHNIGWLRQRKVKCFYALYEHDRLSEGVRAQLQLVGLGKLRPNMVLMGFMNRWREVDPEELEDYLSVIHLAFDLHLSVGILRVREGLDYVRLFETDQGIPFSDCPNSTPTRSKPKILDPSVAVQLPPGQPKPKLPAVKMVARPPPPPPIVNKPDAASLADTSGSESDEDIEPVVMPSRKVSQVVPDLSAKLDNFRRLSSVDKRLAADEIPHQVLDAVNQMQKKQRSTVDVWWLYDDGGLTMLIPYLLSTRAQWEDCDLRVFCIAHGKNAVLDQTQVNVQSLLKKFRIDCSAVTVIPDIASAPKDQSKRDFQKLISKWVTEDETSKKLHAISKAELAAHKERTNRNIRLRELLEENSKSASLIVMTLPMPRRRACPAPLYMAWLETLTSGMPPFLLVRGNQTSVLTFYS